MDKIKSNKITGKIILEEYFTTTSTWRGNTFRTQTQQALSEFKTPLILSSM